MGTNNRKIPNANTSSWHQVLAEFEVATRLSTKILPHYDSTWISSQRSFPGFSYHTLGEFFLDSLAVCSTNHDRNPGWPAVFKRLFWGIPPHALLFISFIFKRGTFTAVVVQTSHLTDWYFGFSLDWRKANFVTFDLSATGCHRVL